MIVCYWSEDERLWMGFIFYTHWQKPRKWGLWWEPQGCCLLRGEGEWKCLWKYLNFHHRNACAMSILFYGEESEVLIELRYVPWQGGESVRVSEWVSGWRLLLVSRYWLSQFCRGRVRGPREQSTDVMWILISMWMSFLMKDVPFMAETNLVSCVN